MAESLFRSVQLSRPRTFSIPQRLCQSRQGNLCL